MCCVLCCAPARKAEHIVRLRCKCIKRFAHTNTHIAWLFSICWLNEVSGYSADQPLTNYRHSWCSKQAWLCVFKRLHIADNTYVMRHVNWNCWRRQRSAANRNIVNILYHFNLAKLVYCRDNLLSTWMDLYVLCCFVLCVRSFCGCFLFVCLPGITDAK